MDSFDKVLLNAVQTRFPVEVRPYQALAEEAGLTESEAFNRLQSLRQSGLIRRLGGVFDSHRLGYYSTLCAAKVPQEKVELLTKLLADMPGVTHNYLRSHQYNMWFTLIAPSKEKVDDILHMTREKSGVKDIYSLPAVRLFKIGVDFDFKENQDSKPQDQAKDLTKKVLGAWSSEQEENISLSQEEIALVRILQGNLPLSMTPFTDIAAELGWNEEDVILKTRGLLDKKCMRRLGAVLRHQKAGFTANAMGVWQVPEEIAEEVGKKMALVREASHVYQRPTLPDWPYNLFTMIHGRSVEECQNVMIRISELTGITRYNMLFSTAELKKSSMQYFMEE